MTPEREEKFKRVIRNRQFNLTVILENVHDVHNLGAVLRSCDSVGVNEVYVLNTDPRLHDDRLQLGKKSSSSARKWVDVHLYNEPEACFKMVKQKYELILSTHLAADSKDMYQLDLTQSVALMFGNEAEGLSETALNYSDGNFIIPQVGMIESLNISVACAVTLYEAYRQRKAAGFYDNHPQISPAEQEALFKIFEERHTLKLDRKFTKRLD